MPLTGSQLLQFSGVSQQQPNSGGSTGATPLAQNNTQPLPGQINGAQLLQFTQWKPPQKPAEAPLNVMDSNEYARLHPQPGIFGNAVSSVLGAANNAANAVKDVPVLGAVAQYGNQVIQSLPETPEYVKQAVLHPFETAAGAGKDLAETAVSFTALLQQGLVGSVNKIFNTNIQVPEAIDFVKQGAALKQLNAQMVATETPEKQKALATGGFLGQLIPYALGGEAVGATLGEGLLVPLAKKFLPAATKFIPVISDAVGFLGVGQIKHDDTTDGTRIDQLKADLTALTFFKIVDFAVGKTTGVFSDKTKKVVSDTVDEYSNKFKKGDEVNLLQAENAVQDAKTAITLDTGKTPESIIATTITDSTELPKVLKTEQPKQLMLDYTATTSDGGTILKPVDVTQAESSIINPNGKNESLTKGQVSQEAGSVKGTENGKIGESTSNKSQPQENVSQSDFTSYDNPVGTRKLKDSRLFQRIKDQLGDALPEEVKNHQVKYNTLNLEQQAFDAIKLATENPEKASRIARGLENNTENMTTYAVRQAIAEIAKERGDWNTYAEFQSKATRGLTRAGQEIVSARGKFNESDPANYIKRVVADRMSQVATTYKGSILDRIKSATESPQKKAQAVIEKQAERLKQTLSHDQIKIKKAQDIIEMLKCK